jgi:hypothetical protein
VGREAAEVETRRVGWEAARRVGWDAAEEETRRVGWEAARRVGWEAAEATRVGLEQT